MPARPLSRGVTRLVRERWEVASMKESPSPTPRSSDRAPEESDARVQVLLDLASRAATSPTRAQREAPDEVVSPDKLDSLLMMITRWASGSSTRATSASSSRPRARAASAGREGAGSRRRDENGEEIDLNLEAELAEASTKRIDDPVRMYLTQMGEIPLLTREQEISLAKKIEITRKIFRSKVLESDYCLQSAVEILQQVDDGDLPFDRTMKISTAEDQADKGTIGERIPLNLASVRKMLRATARTGKPEHK